MRQKVLFNFLPSLAWALLTLPAPLWAAPKVHLDMTEIEFGTVPQGEPVTAELSIGNVGTETLIIQRMEFSVPAMTARLRQRIEPGESATIQVTWDTHRLRRAVAGRMTLYLNDPTTPRVEVELRGDVIPAIEFLPRPAFYFSQYTDEQLTETITLRNNRAEPLALEDASPSSDRFGVSVNATEPGHAFELSVTTRADLPPGRYLDHLRIATNDPDYPQLNVEVNILVKPDVFVTPESIDFGTVSRSELVAKRGAGEFIRQTVVINRRHGTMRVTDVNGSLPSLDITVSPEGPAKGFMLVAGLRPERLETGPLNGTIRVVTDDPSTPTLTIGVRGIIVE